eukprot:g12741.t1
MGAACCEKRAAELAAQQLAAQEGGDDSMTEPDGVMGWASMVLTSFTSLAAELSPTPSEWPRWAWVCVGLWVLTSCYFLLFAMAMYLQELKSYGGASRNVHYYGSLMGQFMFRILSKPPVVIGIENLPPDGDKGMVYVSNHQTSVDIALFYYIGAERRFSWVSKSTVFLIPGVGLLMKIARYVALTRGNRNSVKKMFDDCKQRLASGWSVMIFPQGTRRRLKVLDFKDGAFQLAIDSNSVVVPFTLDLPEDLFHGPKKRTKITVHKPIHPGDPEFKDVATLRKHCFDTVIGALPYAEGMLEEQKKQKEAAEATAAGAPFETKKTK